MDGVRGLVKKRCSVLGLSTVDTTPEARAPEVPMSREMGNCAGTTGASIRPTGWSRGAQRANARRGQGWFYQCADIATQAMDWSHNTDAFGLLLLRCRNRVRRVSLRSMQQERRR